MDDSQKAETPPNSSPRFWWIYAAAMLLMSLGCAVDGDDNADIGEIGICGSSAENSAEGRGQTGYLGFYHAFNGQGLSASPTYYEFDPYLMERSFGTYYVSHWETGEPVRIVDVQSADSQILEVDAIYEASFDVTGVRPGTTEIRVETDSGISDRIQLTVTDLSRVEFDHCCSDDSEAYYLTNSEIEIPVTYFDSYGQTPIGSGRFPFRVSDPDNLQWIQGAADPVDIHLQTGDRAGNITLRPASGIGGRPLTVELISPDQVDGISLHWQRQSYTDPSDPYVSSSDVWFIGGVLYRNDTPLCAGKYAMRYETDTPNVCEFLNLDDQLVSRVELPGDQTVWLEAHTSDDCELRVQLLDDNGGVILEQEVTRVFDRYGSTTGNGYDDDDDFWDD